MDATYTYKTLYQLSYFGQVDVNNIGSCKISINDGTSELLRVDKEDFRSILASTFEEEFQTRLIFMSKLPQFAGVEAETLESCSQHSVLLSFDMDKVVCPKKDDRLIRFIVTGSCDVIRKNLCRPESSLDQSHGTRIPMICPNPWELGGRQKRKSFTINHMAKVKVPAEVDGLSPSGGRMRYLQVGVLDRGAYFGVGEDLSDYIIVSKTRLRLLLLPRSIFVDHLGSNRLRRLRQELEQAIPGEPEVCQLYADDIQWTKYKQEVVEETVEHVTRLHDAHRLRKSKEGARVRSRVKAIPRVVIG